MSHSAEAQMRCWSRYLQTRTEDEFGAATIVDASTEYAALDQDQLIVVCDSGLVWSELEGERACETGRRERQLTLQRAFSSSLLTCLSWCYLGELD